MDPFAATVPSGLMLTLDACEVDQVNVAVPPAVMLSGDAVKLAVGVTGAVTVTVTVFVTLTPVDDTAVSV